MIGGFKKLELAATLCDKRLVETKHGLHFGERGNKRARGGSWIPVAGLTIRWGSGCAQLSGDER